VRRPHWLRSHWRLYLHWLMVATLLLPCLAGANGGLPPWNQELSLGDITIDSRRIEGGLWEFRARLNHVDAPPHAFLMLLLDTSTHSLWLRNTRGTNILKQLSDSAILVQSLFDMPWPYHTRELVNLSRYWQDPRSCVIYLESIATPNAIPPTPDVVRIPLAHAMWQMIPHPDGSMNLTYQGFVDPGGNLPQWLAKGMQQTELRYSFQRLSVLLTQPRYHLKRFPGIDDSCRPQPE